MHPEQTRYIRLLASIEAIDPRYYEPFSVLLAGQDTITTVEHYPELLDEAVIGQLGALFFPLVQAGEFETAGRTQGIADVLRDLRMMRR